MLALYFCCFFTKRSEVGSPAALWLEKGFATRYSSLLATSVTELNPYLVMEDMKRNWNHAFKGIALQV